MVSSQRIRNRNGSKTWGIAVACTAVAVLAAVPFYLASGPSNGLAGNSLPAKLSPALQTPTPEPSIDVNLSEVPIREAVASYCQFTGRTAVIALDLPRNTITVHGHFASKAEAASIIERGLRGQCGVILTNLDESGPKVSVTYNDNWPTVPNPTPPQRKLRVINVK